MILAVREIQTGRLVDQDGQVLPVALPGIAKRACCASLPPFKARALATAHRVAAA